MESQEISNEKLKQNIEPNVYEYPTVVERYYIKKYKTAVKGQNGNDFCILCHSNKLCLVTLAPSHSILREKKNVQSVSFQVDKKRNRLESQASGKNKRNAQFVSETGVVCLVTCTDGSVYTIYSCVKGRLVEVNTRLLDNPSLLVSKPWSEGYVAIILPKLQEYSSQMGALLSPEDYQLHIDTLQMQNNVEKEIPETTDD